MAEGRYEIHEWLQAMSDEDKKKLFRAFTEKFAEQWDEYLEASYDATH